AEDGIRDDLVTGVQTCALPIYHYAKGTPSPRVQPVGWTGWAPTACRHVVSGSLSSPYRGSSHLSLALLGSLSVAREYLALRDGRSEERRVGREWSIEVR